MKKGINIGREIEYLKIYLTLSMQVDFASFIHFAA